MGAAKRALGREALDSLTSDQADARDARAQLLAFLLTPGALTTRFQAIVTTQGDPASPWALECLSRGPRASRFSGAERLFRAVREADISEEIDRACIIRALDAVRRYQLAQDLFLNVHPATLRQDQDFPSFLESAAARHGIALERLTVELVEHDRHVADRSIRDALLACRELGVRIALDDCNADHTDRCAIGECRPDYVKIAKQLIWDARRSTRSRQSLSALVQSMVGGPVVIAEGVEEPNDLELVRELGIPLVQGFLIAQPLSAHALATRPHA